MTRHGLALLALLCLAAVPAQSRQSPAIQDTAVSDPKGLGIRWTRIPSGTFQMGCVPGDTECDTDEKPQHAVTLTRDYWMMTTEVTIEMFRAWASQGHGMPLQPEWNINPRQPIVYVPEAAASGFCGWLDGRLPTEAEFERAARGNIDNLKYAWGNTVLPLPDGRRPANVADEMLQRKFPKTAIFRGYDDGYAWTAPVGSFAPNAFGLYDMTGNVSEWVADLYSEHYPAGSQTDPHVTAGTPSNGIVRGGSWYNSPRQQRLSQRMGFNRNSRWDEAGFRCARDVTR